MRSLNLAPARHRMEPPEPAHDPRRLYDDILARATAYATRVLPQPQASELAHDVTVELLRRNERDATGEHVTNPVIYLAVMRRLRDASRAIKRRSAREGQYLDTQSTNAPAWAQPGANLEARELGERVARTVAQMPRGMREVFLLVREEHLSYKEVAERLGIGVGTVHTQLSRAGALLRECVQQHNADAPSRNAREG